MLYTTINVNDKEYKLRLNARASVDLERKLGRNPLNVLMELSNDKLPAVQDIIEILHAAAQAYQHSFTLDDAYKLYDEMVDDGKTLAEFLPIIVDVFKVSGYFKDSDTEAKN